ncbi:MAG: SIS domain-containing protein [bacterium]
MPDPSRYKSKFIQEFEDSITVKKLVIEKNITVLEKITEVSLKALQNGKKLLFCGNGGSAADSQHIAAEFVSKYKRNRRALPAIALTVDTSILTSGGNDFGYEYIFSRQVEALGQEGDVLFAISTSGNSPNVLIAVEEAKKKGIVTVGFTGESGGKLSDLVDLSFNVPSSDTARIQEVHITAAHALCDIIEQELCGTDG